MERKLTTSLVITFSLDNMSKATEYLSLKDKRLAKLIQYVGDIQRHEVEDLFSFIVCEIVGQMISSKVRNVLISRLLSLCSSHISVESILRLSIIDLRGIGLSYAKATYILNFAKAVSENEIELDKIKNLEDDEVIIQLTSIKGIGIWTAKMVLLFALNRPNVLPVEDGAFIQGFCWLYNKQKTDKKAIQRISSKWNPYSSTAALYLYECVNQNLIAINIRDFLNELE